MMPRLVLSCRPSLTISCIHNLCFKSISILDSDSEKPSCFYITPSIHLSFKSTVSSLIINYTWTGRVERNHLSGHWGNGEIGSS